MPTAQPTSAGINAAFALLPLDSPECGLRLVGTLDLADVPNLAAALAELDPPGRVVLDVSELESICASALHVIRSYAEEAPDRPLVLANAPPHLRRVFEIAGFFGDPALEVRLPDV